MEHRKLISTKADTLFALRSLIHESVIEEMYILQVGDYHRDKIGVCHEIMDQFSGFNDVSSGYWAAEYIKYAALHGWINGYGDGSFHADREINRAEVVTIVNRLLGREADEDYIADNLRKLNTFPDVSRKHWAYYAVMEAANAHTAVLGENESWSK